MIHGRGPSTTRCSTLFAAPFPASRFSGVIITLSPEASAPEVTVTPSSDWTTSLHHATGPNSVAYDPIDLLPPLG